MRPVDGFSRSPRMDGLVKKTHRARLQEVAPEPKRTLVQKEMTRKQFLGYMMGAIIGVLGISNFLKLWSQVNGKPDIAERFDVDKRSGFGTSRFGV